MEACGASVLSCISPLLTDAAGAGSTAGSTASVLGLLPPCSTEDCGVPRFTGIGKEAAGIGAGAVEAAGEPEPVRAPEAGVGEALRSAIRPCDGAEPPSLDTVPVADDTAKFPLLEEPGEGGDPLTTAGLLLPMTLFP